MASKYNKKTKNKIFALILLIVIVLAFALIENIRESLFEGEDPDDYLGERSGPFSVERVVDGDTIIIRMDGARERVRFIGIDVPESVHSDPSKNTEEGRLASDFTKSLLEGQKVSLEFDVQERDKYGRILAYVYLDDEMVNETLLREGHAQAITYPPNVKYQERFRQIQNEREN